MTPKQPESTRDTAPGRVPVGDALLRRILDDIRKAHLFVAVSGGFDSMCLLAAVADALRSDGREGAPVSRDVCLTVCHVHHGLREASDAEAAFVREYCANHDLDYTERRVDARTRARQTRDGVEAAARAVRYEALLAILEAAGYRATGEAPDPGRAAADRLLRQRFVSDEGREALVVLAHHGDDQAETMLLHMQWGTGLRGLAGMRAAEGAIRRPWLDVPHVELVAYDGGRTPHIDDASNRSPRYARNRLRHELLPLWSDVADRDMVPQLLALSRHVAAAEDYMEEEAGRWLDVLTIGTLAVTAPRAGEASPGTATYRYSEGGAGRFSREQVESETARSSMVRETGYRTRLLDQTRWSDVPRALRQRVLGRALRDAGIGKDYGEVHFATVAEYLEEMGSGHLELPNATTLIKHHGMFYVIGRGMARRMADARLLRAEYLAPEDAGDRDTSYPGYTLRMMPGDMPDTPASSVVTAGGILYNTPCGREVRRSDRQGDRPNRWRHRRPGDEVPRCLLTRDPSWMPDTSEVEDRIPLKMFWQHYRIPEMFRDRILFVCDAEDRILHV